MKLEFFEENGFALAKGLLPVQASDSIIESFKKEVLPYDGTLLRSTTMQEEPHHLSDNGMMTNPLMQIEDLNAQVFAQFQKSTFNALAQITGSIEAKTLLGEAPVLIQSAFYQSSVGTVVHEDSHYFDSTHGNLVACWTALEDLHPDSGLLAIYPKTHVLGSLNEGERAAELFQEYHKASLEQIRSYQVASNTSLASFKKRRSTISELLDELSIKPETPQMSKGDVLFFSARTFHMAEIPTQGSDHSRFSLVGHFIPGNEELIRYHDRREALNIETLHGLSYHKTHPNGQ